MKRLFFIFICLFLLTSCWSRREFNELSIAYGLGIDKEDGEYIVSAQVINPEQISGQSQQSQGGGSSSPVLLYEERGKTLLHTIRKMSKTSPRKIYVAHLYILVIGEKLAKEGLGDTLDFLYRDEEFRNNFYIIIAKDSKARDILSTATPFSVSPSEEIFNRLQYSNKNYSPTKATYIKEFITKTLTDGVEPVVPSILFRKPNQSGEKDKSVPEPSLPTGNAAAFHNDKLIGWLNENQADTYNIITNNVESGIYEIKCDEEEKNSILESYYTKTEIKPIYKEGPKIELQIEMRGTISELNCNRDIDTEEYRQMEKKFAADFEKRLSDNIQDIQEDIGVDIFGFGREFYRKKPKIWKKYKDNWNEVFKTMEIDVNVTLQITNTDTIENSYLNKLRGGN